MFCQNLRRLRAFYDWHNGDLDPLKLGLAGFALALLAFARFVQSDISFVTTFVQRS